MWLPKRTAPIASLLSLALIVGTVGGTPPAWADDSKSVGKPLSEGRRDAARPSSAVTAASQATPTPTPAPPEPASNLAGRRDAASATSRSVPSNPTVDYGGSANDRRPVTRTATLDVEASLASASITDYRGGLTGGSGCAELNPFPGAMAGHVGWGQTELPDGTRCEKHVLQLAVDFENGDFAEIPTKSIDRVVLTYDEAAGPLCPLVLGMVTPCWADGDGVPQHKPGGCAIVRIPAADWRNAPTNGLIPHITDGRPAVKRLGAREWDVTEAYTWQNVRGAAPLGAVPGYGFLLDSDLQLHQLTADDSTNCVSQISSIRLHVTYTVTNGQTGGPTDVIR